LTFSLTPTAVYDDYWRFAAERHRAYLLRLVQPTPPWTDDPIISAYRFTNVFRAADRVSQYLIAEVQYGRGRSQDPIELFFRTMLFNLFKKIETWELLETALGPIDSSIDLELVSSELTTAMLRGDRIYTAAYIMPSPAFGYDKKHKNHLALLAHMLAQGLPAKLLRARSLREVYEAILAYSGIGPFLAYQYAIDLNYTAMLEFREDEFVVPGPGALDGIAKCFSDLDGATPTQVIHRMHETQEQEFARLGLRFGEISKYARMKHPSIRGVNDRLKIKQNYRVDPAPIPIPFFPPRWGINI